MQPGAPSPLGPHPRDRDLLPTAPPFALLTTLPTLVNCILLFAPQPGAPSPLAPQPRDWDLLLTAETHNFPCAVAPYPGAETGAGGRMRDTHATGTGSIMGAGTAGETASFTFV